MKILLDNCVPRPFEKLLPECVHCSRLGWGRLANGFLLSAAEEAGFAVLVTVDRSMQFQQSMEGRAITVIYLRVPKNDMASLKPMVPLVLSYLEAFQPGSATLIKHPDWRD